MGLNLERAGEELPGEPKILVCMYVCMDEGLHEREGAVSAMGRATIRFPSSLSCEY